MELCASSETLAEMYEVLNRSKFDRYLDPGIRREAAEQIERDSRIFSVGPVDTTLLKPSCRDSSDNKFLTLALAAEVDVIVSSDDDLLTMHPWHGIPILTPAQFAGCLTES